MLLYLVVICTHSKINVYCIIIHTTHHIDGSTSESIQTIATIEDGNLTYINGEANSTVWPGWFLAVIII